MKQEKEQDLLHAMIWIFQEMFIILQWMAYNQELF